MGATTSSTEYSDASLKNFQKTYSFIRNANDTRFGNISIYKSISYGNKIMVSNKSILNETEQEELIKELKLRTGLDHANLLCLVGYSNHKNDHLCGVASTTSIYSEYYELNLLKEIMRRQESKEYFYETEIWYMADSIISVLAYLENNHIYHGDVRPVQVMLTEDGFVKVGDHGMLNLIKNNYHKRLSGNNKVYLSPELLNAYAHKHSSPSFNVAKSDVYSFGMTLLYIANLTDPILSCYDTKQENLNRRGIEESIANVRTRYSQFLAEFIEWCLNENPEDRPNFAELDQNLAPYHGYIRNMENFTTVNAPVSPATIVESYRPNEYIQQPLAQSQLLSSQPLQASAFIPQVVQVQPQTQAIPSQYVPQQLFQSMQPVPQTITQPNLLYSQQLNNYANTQPVVNRGFTPRQENGINQSSSPVFDSFEYGKKLSDAELDERVRRALTNTRENLNKAI